MQGNGALVHPLTPIYNETVLNNARLGIPSRESCLKNCFKRLFEPAAILLNGLVSAGETGDVPGARGCLLRTGNAGQHVPLCRGRLLTGAPSSSLRHSCRTFTTYIKWPHTASNCGCTMQVAAAMALPQQFKNCNNGCCVRKI